MEQYLIFYYEVIIGRGCYCSCSAVEADNDNDDCEVGRSITLCEQAKLAVGCNNKLIDTRIRWF